MYDGAVYELSHEVVASEPATTFSVTLDPADGDVGDDETVRYGDLPAVDREVFERRGWDDPGFLGFGTTVLYLRADVPDSALVPEPERPVVVWDGGTRGRFEVDGSYDTELKTYRYEAERVRESAAALGADTRAAYAFELSGLTDAEAEVVEEAIAGDHGYAVPPDESVPEPMRGVAERFRSEPQVRSTWANEDGDERPSVTGSYLVRYGGEVYWTHVYLTPELTPTAPTSA